jgi:malate/lactate dehydrogenase
VEQHLQVSLEHQLGMRLELQLLYLVDSILNDQKKMIACSVFVEGEYGKMIFVLVFLVYW